MCVYVCEKENKRKEKEEHILHFLATAATTLSRLSPDNSGQKRRERADESSGRRNLTRGSFMLIQLWLPHCSSHRRAWPPPTLLLAGPFTRCTGFSTWTTTWWSNNSPCRHTFVGLKRIQIGSELWVQRSCSKRTKVSRATAEKSWVSCPPHKVLQACGRHSEKWSATWLH